MPYLDMRVIDGAAELACGVVAEHAPGHIATAGAAEHRAAVQRSVAVKLAVVHVSGGALQMAHLFMTPEKRLAAILSLPYLELAKQQKCIMLLCLPEQYT